MWFYIKRNPGDSLDKTSPAKAFYFKYIMRTPMLCYQY